MLEPRDFGKVAVLMGGRSAERAVSLKSGQTVLKALRERGVDAHAIDVGEDLLERLSLGGFDRAFIALHGRGGEDGVIQGALETLGMPYTGSGVPGSALSMDKYRCKLIWRALGVPTPASVLIREEMQLQQAELLGFPLMIKPSHEGSSVGMAKVDTREALRSCWLAAVEYDNNVLAEQWIMGAEYTAAILKGKVLPLIRLETPHRFYDYEAKYVADTTQYHCPCGLNENEEMKLAELALNAFEAVEAVGWGRVDILTDEAGGPWVIEVNTVPGMTDHSLVPMAAQAAGIDLTELVWRVLETSLERG